MAFKPRRPKKPEEMLPEGIEPLDMPGAQYQDITSLVPPKVEALLLNALKERAREKCKKWLDAYTDCTRDKVFDIFSACREQLQDMNECLHQYTDESQQQQIREKWMEQQRRKRRAIGRALGPEPMDM
mmetsp:Transcript_3375/g.3716  ORF Transcript_3375/g.3716 Transcript_3375/m.3716 type:complete len:128 (+) Transcript_3375:22-405(+)|eukprot:CAMPEP_0168516776 /NCGR_PEP_ID=MMETSP0405-20121227/5615_1 /TAXON_ID=498012 /ORGANISM="Trichosphaerium sp, Strain Am-I-7 wt" /LENGTH=127 /DNA_ID=CAMNT_0008536575 /DNA_START=90 /DNA_END=473 /DNA_ORIENTATION=+